LANVEQCRAALDDLVASLGEVDPLLRAKHVPRRTVSCRINDLELTFQGRIDEHGVHDVKESIDADGDADVRLSMDSDVLIALAAREDDFLHAWLRGRVQVSASMRDLLRLRSLFGL
jgi:predicted lipid carrier protein YhbT